MLTILLFPCLFFPDQETAQAAAVDLAKKEVHIASARYEKALAEKNKSALENILAQEFVLTTATGKKINKANMLANLGKQETRYESFDSSEVEVRVAGATAIETGKVRTVGIRAGKKIDETTRFTLVWIRTAAGWKALAEHSSFIPEK